MCIAAAGARVIACLENILQNREQSVDTDGDTFLNKTATAVTFFCGAATLVSAGFVIRSREIHNACVNMT